MDSFNMSGRGPSCRDPECESGRGSGVSGCGDLHVLDGSHRIQIAECCYVD